VTNAEFQSIFENNQHAVYGFAWRMTGSPETAEDIAQDCFLWLLKSPECYNDARGPIRAWLLGIARNLILKRWRAEGRWTTLDDDAVLVDPPSVDCSADEKVAQAVQSLVPLQREVLILVEYQGLTLEETADAVAVEVGTVKARLHRARNNLRRTLEPLRIANTRNYKT
jgi:RNA polymerase sigma factor (sigma-70 family)